jgi:hypothetical protein
LPPKRRRFSEHSISPGNKTSPDNKKAGEVSEDTSPAFFGVMLVEMGGIENPFGHFYHHQFDL